MPQRSIHDAEFGDILYRRLPTSRSIRVRVMADGQLRATLPPRAPLAALQRLVDGSRPELRHYAASLQRPTYSDKQTVGHSHQLHIMRGTTSQPLVSVKAQHITVVLPLKANETSVAVQDAIRTGVEKALRVEAKAYLPRRLAYLAQAGSYSYDRVRFANQSGRWGSCSTNGTVSLNIALMRLPFELIDYVLVHELAHTRQMNHSPTFWVLVEQGCPDYIQRRRQLKDYHPFI